MSQDVEIVCGDCGESLAQITLSGQSGPCWQKVRCKDCVENPNGVLLTLIDGASGAMREKKVDLAKTVKAFLGFDAKRLLPRIASADEYSVRLERTNSLLSHHETLEERGVQANDTLIITELPPKLA